MALVTSWQRTGARLSSIQCQGAIVPLVAAAVEDYDIERHYLPETRRCHLARNPFPGDVGCFILALTRGSGCDRLPVMDTV
jgi:hypothetical protein